MKRLSLGIVTLIMATVTVLCFVVGAQASDPAPDKYPDGTAFNATAFADFDGTTGYSYGQLYKNANYSNEIIENGGFSGKALKTNATKAEGQPSIVFDTPVDMTPYSGIMFYVDATGVTHGSIQNFGLGLRIFTKDLTAVVSTQPEETFAWIRNTQTTKFNDVDLSMYYYSEGVWNKMTQSSSPANGERFNLPANFCGFVYYPFSSYISRMNTDALEAGIKGLDSVTRIALLTNNYTFPSSFIVDNFTLVRDASLPEITTDPSSVTTKAPDVTTPQADVTTTEEPEASTTAEITTSKTPDTTPDNTPDKTVPTPDVTTEPVKSSCGGFSVIVAVLSVQAALAASAIVVIRKKR